MGAHFYSNFYQEFQWDLGHDHEVKECKNCHKKVTLPCWRCDEAKKAANRKVRHA